MKLTHFIIIHTTDDEEKFNSIIYYKSLKTKLLILRNNPNKKAKLNSAFYVGDKLPNVFYQFNCPPEAFPQPLFRLTPSNTVLPRVCFFVSLTSTRVTRCYQSR